jgi:succinyl-CoA synthetase beta subunit
MHGSGWLAVGTLHQKRHTISASHHEPRHGIDGDDALAHAIVALSRLADDASVAEAEINPLMVRPAGEGVVAVDAVARLMM